MNINTKTHIHREFRNNVKTWRQENREISSWVNNKINNEKRQIAVWNCDSKFITRKKL